MTSEGKFLEPLFMAASYEKKPKEYDPMALPESEWRSAELEFYTGFRCNMPYQPSAGTPSSEQLQQARAEFKRRFMSEEKIRYDDGVPGVLVCTNVPATWTQCDSDGVKYWMTAANDLYIIAVPSTIHGDCLADIAVMCKAWANNFGLTKLMKVSSGRRENGMFQADVSMRPLSPWDASEGVQPQNRVMIEIEYKHRGVSISRAQGHQWLAASHFHRAYVLIKIYPKRNGTPPRAAAALWHKNPFPPAAALPPPPCPAGPMAAPTIAWPAPTAANAADALLAAGPVVAAAAAPPPVTAGGISFVSAFDFGPTPLSQSDKAFFTSPGGVGLLPPVLPFPPHLGLATAANAHNFLLPMQDVLYLVRDDFGNLVYLPPAANLALDLAALQDNLARLNSLE